MSKYIKVFDTVEEYNAYSRGTAFTSPNISYIKSTDETKYDDNEIKHYSEDCESGDCESIITSKEINGNTISSISNLIETVNIPSGITTLGENCFYGLTYLTSVTLPVGITEIPNNCFKFCYSLENIELPNTITTIGSNAFDNVSVWGGYNNDLVLPPSVRTINSQAFRNCGKKVILNEGLQTIGDCAFYAGTTPNYPHYTIPSTVTYMGSEVFYCTSSEAIEITMLPIAPPTLTAPLKIKNNVGFGLNPIWEEADIDHITLYVPSESIDAYKTATNWKLYSSRIFPIE